MSIWEDLLWSLPDRLWLLGGAGAERQAVEDEARLTISHAYLWLTPDQLNRCRELLQAEPSFLLAVLDRVYQPVLATGRYAPFPAVTYLVVGYLLHHVQIPPRPAPPDAPVALPTSVRLINWLTRGSAVSDPVGVWSDSSRFVTRLNQWLAEILAFEYQLILTPEQRAAQELRRANWPAVLQFVRRALSVHEIGAPHAPLMDARVCQSEKVRGDLWRSNHGRALEQRLLAGLPPVAQPYRDPQGVSRLLEDMGSRILAQISQVPEHESPPERDRRLAVQHQTRAIRYYLGRAGIRRLLGAGTRASAYLLDLHALSGYQAHGRFVPDSATHQLMALLRRTRSDPDTIQQSRESAVEGITRRGAVSQLLKWQLALPRALVYERYVNRKLLYHRRVSQRSQDLSVTLVFAVDVTANAARPTAHGARVHSLGREICAHLVQDCHQALWHIPRLFIDAILVMHDQEHLVWKTALALSDGDRKRPVADDLFLRELPAWADEALGLDDPATFFQFVLPALTTPAGVGSGRRHRAGAVAQTIELVGQVRRARLAWLRQTGREAANQATDFVVTTQVVLDGKEGRVAARSWQELRTLALRDAFWACVAADRIELERFEHGRSRAQLSCELTAFQQMLPAAPRIGDRERPAPLRQWFVQDLLRSLVSLCTEVEA